jgi:hypothetical protein
MICLGRMVYPTTGLKLFDVTYVRWVHFRDAMVDQSYSGTFWYKAAKADCLIGGVDISLSYL